VLSISALVSGASWIKTQSCTGKHLFQFVIRHNRKSWGILVSESGLPSAVQQQLLAPNLTMRTTDPRAGELVRRWFALKWPTELRTLQGLATIRKFMSTAPEHPSRFVLSQILFLHDELETDDPEYALFVRDLGVEMLPCPEDESLALSTVLRRVNADYLWLVPGGCLIESSSVGISLAALLGSLNNDSRRAGFSDGAYSCLFRVSALRSLPTSFLNVKSLSNVETVKALLAKGFLVKQESQINVRLAQVEEIYGGTKDTEETFR
jgi:hypothetical protein